MEIEGKYRGLRAGAELQRVLGWLRLHPWQGCMLAAGALLIEVIAFIAGALLVSWLGIYDVAATATHTKGFAWFLHFTMRNSVKAHASGTAPSLDDVHLIAKGRSYAVLRCAPCHGAPGRSPDVSAGKMLPEPPNIRTLTRGFTPAQLHWIIKHGVKMSPMPAWATQQRDDEIWSLVAYLEHVSKPPSKLPGPAQQKDEGEGGGGAGLGGNVSLKTCYACHGADGNGNGAFPKLAGLSEDYIRTSVQDYRSGARQSGYMQPFAANLSDAEIATFASHFGHLDRKPEVSASTDPHLLQRGAAIAEPALSTRAMPACMTCHTPDRSKRSPAVPDLAGQPAHYISTQLQLFRTGVRGKTDNGQIMGRIARRLSDSDIEAVAAYFAARPTQPADDKMATEGGGAR